MSYILTSTFQLGKNKAGLSLVAQLCDTLGNVVTSGITGFIDRGLGNYLLTYNSYPSGFRGAIEVFDNNNLASGSLAIGSINPESAERIDSYITSRSTTLDISNTLSSLHGNSNWGTSVVGSNTVTLNTTDQNNNIIGGATLSIYPSGSSNIVYYGQTNTATGQSIVNLNNGAYAIYVFQPSVAYWSNPYFINVSGNNTFNFPGKIYALPPAPVANLVRLYTYTTDLGLNVVAGISMIVSPSGAGSVTYNKSDSILQNSLIGTSDNNGYVYVDVAASGIPVRVRIPDSRLDKTFMTPTSGYLNVASL